VVPHCPAFGKKFSTECIEEKYISDVKKHLQFIGHHAIKLLAGKECDKEVDPGKRVKPRRAKRINLILKILVNLWKLTIIVTRRRQSRRNILLMYQ
jgi:hypothetical protein